MIGITMGDPNGIGPEILTKVLNQAGYADCCVIGHAAAMPQLAKGIQVIDPFGSLSQWGQAQAMAEGGSASYAYVQKAIAMARDGEIEAIVTGPLNKEALHLAGIHKDGHTEILAEAFAVKKFGMFFYSSQLNIMLTTIHKPLSQVPDLITKEKMADTIDLAVLGLRQLGIVDPHIAVAGLNPHAGEQGIFGREELDIIQPVIAEYQEKGLAIKGPFPADTLFIENQRQQYDLIIAHYHDQGLIPLKMLAFDSAVNITVGLPIIRTSVDHGTGYQIVGQNKAHTGSLEQAIAVARRMIKNRNI